MAAIGLRTASGAGQSFYVLWLVALCLVPPVSVAADASADARAQVTAVAEALSSGDAAEAMTHFSKSLPDYEKLRRDFDGLSAFQVENQLSITDEEDSDKYVALTITWDLTLTDLATDKSKRRTGEVHVKLVPDGSKWRIVDFAPREIFNPQL